MTERFFVDLFAGCGGLSLGLEQAGFTPALVNELSPLAMETYLTNRDLTFPLLRQKYHTFDIEELVTNHGAKLDLFARQFRHDYGFSVSAGELDLLVGGPPCQGYSRIGHRRLHATDRHAIASNHLYLKMVRAIHILKPRIFLFENVLGLRTAAWTRNGIRGEIWKHVLASFESLSDYQFHPQPLYAKDYGVPQNRPRLLIIGIRNDVRFSECDRAFAKGYLPTPIGGAPDLEELLSDLIDLDYENGGETLHYPHPPTSLLQKHMRYDPNTQRFYEKGFPLAEHKYSRHHISVIEKFSKMIALGGVIDSKHQTRKFAQRLLPAKWGCAGPNITVTSLPDDYVHYQQPRTPTVRECARMQTFPDWYRFSGPRTTGGVKRAGQPSNGILEREVPKYTQIANAVPVAMARVIGCHFNVILNENT